VRRGQDVLNHAKCASSLIFQAVIASRARGCDRISCVVCAVCGHSEWLVILEQPDVPLAEFRAHREVKSFFDAKARAG
jgi:hypothetical protein